MKHSLALTACAALLAFGGSAFAQTYNEVGDTGQLLGTAQAVGFPITRIEGAIGLSGDIDLFSATFDFTGTLTIDALTITGGTDLDLNLHAFNGAGNPIGANDDALPTNDGLDSQLVLSITPGTYYFGVGDNNLEANDAGGNRIQDNDSGVLDPNGVLAGWQGPGPGTGTYAIVFSTATAVPAPSALAAFLLGAVPGVGMLLRRRRK